MRDEGVAIGRLVRKADTDSEGEGLVEHWIVSLDGQSGEEEVTEKYIGRIVEEDDTESKQEGDATTTDLPVSKGTGTTRLKEKKQNGSKAKRSTLTGRYEQSNKESRPSTRAASRNKSGDTKLLKGVKHIKKTSKQSHNNNKTSGNETLVKVKMLTGTLYLYRGDKPRAEFIRRF